VHEDIQVIQDILQGQTNLYEILMNKYHNEIFSFVFNMVGQYQDTEDLVQDIFYKTYMNLSKYDSSKSQFRTWLYRIASNHTLNHLKKARTRYTVKTEVDLSLLEDKTDIIADVIKEDQMNQIIDAMKRILKPKALNIMTLYYFSGLTVKEISETLNIPDKTIYKAIKASVEKIKQEVTEYA